MSMFKVPDGKMFILPPMNTKGKTGSFHVARANGSALFRPKKQNVCGCPICDFVKERTAMSKPKLVPQVLPAAARGQDFKSLAQAGRCKYWTSLKDEALSKHGSQCFYCTANPEQAQEVWHFDYDAGLMTVADLVPVCRYCQMAINIADTEDRPDFPAVVQHIGTVLGIKKVQVGELIREAYQLWEERSQRAWKVSHGAFSHFLHLPGKLPETTVFDQVAVLKDHQRLPSQTEHVNYLHVKRNPKSILTNPVYPCFILSGSFKQMDDVWPLVATMTKNGHLAAEALASTRRKAEGNVLLPTTGFVTIVLEDEDSKEEIEKTLKVLFGSSVQSITFSTGVLMGKKASK